MTQVNICKSKSGVFLIDHDTVKPLDMDGHFRSRRPTDYFLVLLLVLALLAALAALLIAILVISSALFNIQFDDIFPNADRLAPKSLIFAGVFVLLLVAFIFAILARWRIRRNRSYQFSGGCPICQKHDMIRIHRRRRERLLAKVSRLPFRRYACRNCQWQGALLFYYADGIIFERVSEPMLDFDTPNAAPIIGTLAADDSLVDMEIEAVAVQEPASSSPQFVDVGTVSDENSGVDELTTPEEPLRESEPENVIGIISRAIVVAPYGLSLRSAPNNDAEILLLLEPDSIVGILEPEEDDSPANWRQIRYEGQSGWVSAAFLRHLSS